MKKDDIRRRVRARKSLLTEQEKSDAARSVFDRLEQMAAFMVADRILMYHSLPDELYTRAFLGFFPASGAAASDSSSRESTA